MGLSPEFEKMTVEVDCGDRWVVFARLQSLEVRCSCSYYQPLMVELHSVVGFIQTWSVLRQVTAPRAQLVHHLDNCWHQDHIGTQIT